MVGPVALLEFAGSAIACGQYDWLGRATGVLTWSGAARWEAGRLGVGTRWMRIRRQIIFAFWKATDLGLMILAFGLSVWLAILQPEGISFGLRGRLSGATESG